MRKRDGGIEGERRRGRERRKREGREEKRDIGRVRDLSSVGSLAKWLQQPGNDQDEARSQELHVGLHMGGRGPRTWPIINQSSRRLAGHCIGNGASRTPNSKAN